MIEKRVRMNFAGDILDVPYSALDNPSWMNWLMTPNHSGAKIGDHIEAMAKAGWLLYASTTGQYKPDSHRPILKRNRFQLWLRCKLTGLGII